MAPAKLFLRLVSLLVPRDARPTWLAEWRAELEHAWSVAGSQGEPGPRARARLTIRAIESASDALWLRWRHMSRAVPAETLRHAARGLARRPAFALTVVATLGLGVGASTAIFTVVDALLVRPLPFRAPDELVAISAGPSPSSGLDEEALRVWRSQEVFSDVKARVARPVIVGGAGEARYERAELVEPGFLALLGLRPALGRALTPDDVTGDGRVVLLSEELWREGFGRDPDVVGRTVEVDGEPHAVVGVLPAELRRTTDGIVGLMMPLSDPPPNDRVHALGRLRSDVPLDVAQARLGDVARILSSERPREEAWQVRLWPLEQGIGEDLRRGLLALGAAVLCLLLVSYANAAGLLLMRGLSRRPEIRLRVALGASRAALVSQVLAESVLLAAGAGLVGTIFAWWGAQGLVALLPSGAVRFSYNPISVDGRVLGFALFLTLVTGVAFGTLPAWRAARSAGQGTGRTTTSSRDAVRIRAGIHVAQLALALVLVAAAGVFTGSFRRLMTADLGYDVSRVLQIHLVSLERLTGQEATIAFAAELDDRLRALPGVAGVTRASGMGFTFDFTLETAEGAPSAPSPNMLPHMSVDTAYFRTMGIPVVEGRGFASGDMEDGADVVVIDRDLAGTLWPDAPAVGRRFRIDAGPWLTVIGVTADVKLEGPREPLGPYRLFYPAAREALRNGMVVVRTSGDPATVAPAVRSLVRELDPDQPIGSVETGIQAVRSFVADPRLLAFITSALAGAATFLAAVGVYGLVSFGVAQRRREIGVRMALGAPSGRVTVEVLRSGLALAVGGIGLGLVVTLIVSRPLAALLYETSALDPKVLALAAVTLLAATAVALVGPARRAATTDPAETLRDE